ncbi:CgeB family protein [Bacillus halotolerans]|uniref:CgeB family protein n=1 Tax=Bacillus halotolerans TaxID=260554 RepID=UPI00398F6B5E
MKVLYIQSGYGGIYSYFDRWAEECFRHAQTEYMSADTPDTESLSRIETFQPDFALMMVGVHVPHDWLTWLKGKGIPVYVWLTEDPFYIDISLQVIKHADAILTIDQNAALYYQELGYQHIYYAPIPVNHRLFKKMDTEHSFHSQLLIIGYPYPNRVQLVKEAAYLPYTIRVIGKEWRKYLPKKVLKQPHIDVVSTWVPPEQAVHYYNGADIVINPHRPYHFTFNKNKSSIKNTSFNNRTFDIAACEAFQLVDLPAAHPFSSFISYHSINDFKEKAAFYINHPEERNKAAALNYKETVPAHTFDELPAKLKAIHLALS